jgi:hypothetical protein
MTEPFSHRADSTRALVSKKQSYRIAQFSPKATMSHKFARTGRYASEEENGEDMDMCQIQAPISFREFKKIVWKRAIRNSAS